MPIAINNELETKEFLNGIHSDAIDIEALPYQQLADKTFELAQAEDKAKHVISLSFVSTEKIQTINNEFRQKDAVTDVLSFPALEIDLNFEEEDIEAELGDIIICIDRAVEQAQMIKQSLRREVCFLFVHGLLHLLGYDHMTPEEEKEMFGLQHQVLLALKIQD